MDAMELQVLNLGVARGGLVMLEGINFAISCGQALILRGPNGIGKTTLLRTIAGLQPPVSGEVVAEADNLAYASHADGLKSTLTAEENLQFWADIYRSDQGAVARALVALDLLSLRNRPAAQLSAGQKRRLGLARLLVTGRRVWLLDEPTVSLDQASVQLFANLVRNHLQEGGAALMATHIDLGLPEVQDLDLTPFKPNRLHDAKVSRGHDFDEAFL